MWGCAILSKTFLISANVKQKQKNKNMMYNNIIIFDFLVQPHNLTALSVAIIGFRGWLCHFFLPTTPQPFNYETRK